jgi:NHL repeat-containing protein
VDAGFSSARVQEFTHSGGFVTAFGSMGSGAGQFKFSNFNGLAADPKGNLWITDGGNNRVQRWWVR